MEQTKATILSQPTHHYRSHHFETKNWEKVNVRKEDVVICTPGKAGTTWIQAVVFNLFTKGSEFPMGLVQMCPWVDMRITPEEAWGALEALPGRRCFKTHCPAHGIPIYNDVKYIVSARDVRDMFMSLFDHWCYFSDGAYQLLNSGGGIPFPRPTEDINIAFKDFLTKPWPELSWEKDGYPFWSFFGFVSTWWKLKSNPNVMFIHMDDMKANPKETYKQIAKFLEIENISDVEWDKIVANCTFDALKNNKMVLGDLGAFFP
eukprot:TRINITY_DN5917_c0_g5_i2.p1 TRINITY_DN5917_c0_g5~~TRINITY_DN5917_c0_g5_i2.p1  ORF type:complete len:261 (-),score=56.90 TRINITY_DN5917_c0_g5_i2:203-985(-)